MRRATGEDTHMTNPPPAPGDESTPRWVKVLGIIAIVLIVLFVILHLTGNSPRGHTPSGHPGEHSPPASVTENGEQKP